MKKLITILMLIFCASEMSAQNYIHSAGIRLGAASGITYRRMLDHSISGELMLLSQNNGTVLAFLVQKHRPALLFNKLNVNFIWGAGAHLGMAKGDRYSHSSFDHYRYRLPYNTLQLGVDGFAALEYELPRYPVSVSLECKPYFELFNNRFPGIHLPVVAMGFRYTF